MIRKEDKKIRKENKKLIITENNESVSYIMFFERVNIATLSYDLKNTSCTYGTTKW